jgi:pimeloyl-ACP methyl ester carboxylesterase
MDADHDGHGAGDPVTLCLALGQPIPVGYATTAGDCNDSDPGQWGESSLFVDADGDGIGAGELVRVCGVEMFTPGHVEMFPAETAQSMYDFRADDVVGQIAPRPLLLLHSSTDSVTPTEQSIELFKRAGTPTDLHLFADVDHFMFAESNTRVRSVIFDWLEKYFPARSRAKAA